MRPQSTEVVAAREETGIDRHAAGLGVRVDAGHPGAHAVRVEDVVPSRIERVREVDASAVPADLDHLWRTPEWLLGSGGMRGAADDAAQAHRACLFGVVRVADVVLLDLARSPARHVE